MKTFQRHELPPIELQTVEVGGKRFYVTPEGNRYPSVTTVLSSRVKDGIEAWKKRVGEDAANRIMKRATNRGTDMHLICEDYLLNKLEYKKNKSFLALEMFQFIKPILDEHVGVIYGNELALYSDTLQVAGRSDMFCQFMGTNTIVDFKTSTKDKKEDWIEDYFLQSTCYAMMVEECYNHIRPIHIPQIAIIVAVEEGESRSQLFVKKTRDYRDKVKQIFAEYHANQQKTSL